MHETMVAESLFSTILAEAEKQNAKPIAAAISCGMLNAINDEVLAFAFEAIAKDTICEGLKLQVEHKPMQGKCKSCGGSFDIDISQPKCPNCQSQDFELLPEAPLVLETIELETEDSDVQES